MTDIIQDAYQEILKFANGLGDRGKSTTTIQYSVTEKAAYENVRFNSEPQVSRLHPVLYGELNPPRDGVKFNS